MRRRVFLKQMAVGAALAAIGLPQLTLGGTATSGHDRKRTARFYLSGGRDSGGCAVPIDIGNLHERFPQLYPA